MKKLICLAMVLVLMIGNTGNVSAKSQDSNASEESFQIITTNEYYDREINAYVKEVISFMPATNSANDTRGISGSGTFRNTKTITWNANDPDRITTTTYYIQGYFEWDDDTDYISVSNVYGYVAGVPSTVIISNIATNIYYGQYLFFFDKYAEISYSFTTTDVLGIKENWSVSLRVSQAGNVS